jgi:hypothetical protein
LLASIQTLLHLLAIKRRKIPGFPLEDTPGKYQILVGNLMASFLYHFPGNVVMQSSRDQPAQ